ncbi:MAG: DUF2237 domain-containing protein [Pseudomonadota bacterium]
MNDQSRYRGEFAVGPEVAKNVLGGDLQPCSFEPLTGFFRDGCCNTDVTDTGRHLVCGVMSDAFLQFSKSLGNDLITPRPEFNFPGLKAGDRWCLCVDRWFEAYKAGCAPRVVLEATHENVLDDISADVLSALADHCDLKLPV